VAPWGRGGRIGVEFGLWTSFLSFAAADEGATLGLTIGEGAFVGVASGTTLSSTQRSTIPFPFRKHKLISNWIASERGDFCWMVMMTGGIAGICSAPKLRLPFLLQTKEGREEKRKKETVGALLLLFPAAGGDSDVIRLSSVFFFGEHLRELRIRFRAVFPLGDGWAIPRGAVWLCLWGAGCGGSGHARRMGWIWGVAGALPLFLL